MESRTGERRTGNDGLMNAEQEAHLDRIKIDFMERVDKKYRRGAAEHGGELLGMSSLAILDAAIDEAVDQVTYLLSLREKLLGGVQE